MRIGYARVSTQEQDNQAQISALQSAGCELIFQEKASGGRWDRGLRANGTKTYAKKLIHCLN
ncbi:recombinase family protein [Escherichia coli]